MPLKPTRPDGLRKLGSFCPSFWWYLGRRNSGTHEEEAEFFPEFLSSTLASGPIRQPLRVIRVYGTPLEGWVFFLEAVFLRLR